MKTARSNQQIQSMPKGNQLNKFGGTCAILAGICYLFMGLMFFFDPTVNTRTHEDFWHAMKRKPLPHILGHYLFGLASIFMLGAIPAITQIVLPFKEALVRWATSLANLGYALLAAFSFRAVAIDRGRAKDYVEGNEMTKIAVVHGGMYLDELDPHGYLDLGGTGFWLFVNSLLAWRHKLWPRGLSQVGIGGALVSWIAMLGSILNSEILIITGAIGAVVIAPIFLIWIGLFLHRTE